MIKKGKAWIYKDDVDTDVIIPARYLNTTDAKELAEHCMEDIDESFAKNVREGDIIIAGENFGCGSSREHAPIAIKASGVSVVIAKSFARIFYRNAINIGLPILENLHIADESKLGDEIEVNLDSGEISNLTSCKTYKTPPFPKSIQELIQTGGLISYTQKKFGNIADKSKPKKNAEI